MKRLQIQMVTAWVLLVGTLASSGCRPAPSVAPSHGQPPASSAPGSRPNERQGVRDLAVLIEGEGYFPEQLSVQPGQKVRLTVQNGTSTPRNLVIELPGGEVRFRQPLPPGKSEMLEFTAPREAGEYPFYSPVENGARPGKKGTLRVGPSGSGGSVRATPAFG